MHPYSTNESRVTVCGILAVISVVISWLIVSASSVLSWPQWLVSAPSMAGVFAGLYAGFDQWAWRWRWLSRVGLVGIADCSGQYDGKLISTYVDDAGKQIERDITIQVDQTWTSLSVTMNVRTGSSSSYSISAVGGLTQDGKMTCLSYMYRNKVYPGLADADMGDHEGAAELRIDSAGNLSGRYFNSRPRSGSIVAKRISA